MPNHLIDKIDLRATLRHTLAASLNTLTSILLSDYPFRSNRIRNQM